MNSNADSRRAANPKLPLWDTICLAYSTYFDNFSNVLRVSWLWLVVVAPISGFASWAQWAWMSGLMTDLGQKAPAQIAVNPLAMPPLSASPLAIPPEIKLLIYSHGLVMLLAGVSIAVAWHRLILLGERPRLSGTNLATVSLWRYAGMALAIYVIATLPALVIFFLSGNFSFSYTFSPGAMFPSAPGAAVAHPGAAPALFFVFYIRFFHSLFCGCCGHASPEHLAPSARSR